MRRRDIVAAVLIVAFGIALLQLPQARILDGLSLDYLFWLRYTIYGQRHLPASSPTVVVAIDEETFRTKPFSEIPVALWTPQLARVVRALLTAHAKVIGLDLILPTSAEPIRPGYDRDLLLTLREGSKEGRIVLAKVQSESKPISPFPAQSFAVGNSRNIRAVNFFVQYDDVVRSVPILFESENADLGVRREPSFALELAARASRVSVAPVLNGVAFGERFIPGSESNTLRINFDGGASIPTYSFADLSACAQARRDQYFNSHFKDKVVLIGSVLDLEDRKLTSKRLIAGGDSAVSSDRCFLRSPADIARQDVARDQIPSVYIHAAAINELLRGEMLHEPSAVASVAMTAALAAAVVASLFMLPVSVGIGATLLEMMLWVGISTIMVRHNWVLPMLPAVVGAAGCGVAIVGFRVFVSDRDKR